MGRPKLHMSRDDQKVARGLDPRSIFPRCDFCSRKDARGTVQHGRWWAHADCACDPVNLALRSASLPALDYTQVVNRRTSIRMVAAMRHRILAWSGERCAILRQAAHERGDLLEISKDEGGE